MSDIAYLNGEFMKLAEAFVPIEDRGFQFGDGVYEVIRVYRHVPHLLREHLDRLKLSAASIHLDDRLSYDEWERIVRDGIDRSGYAEAKVYIQVTRGVSPRDHRFPLAAPVTRVMTVREMEPDDCRLRETGVATITVPDIRWNRCDIKSLNLLPNILAKQQATRAGAFEALFVRDGQVFEGSSSTVMAIRDIGLHTPPEGPRILSGITRDWVLNLAREDGIPVHEEPLSMETLLSAREVFLTGTTIELIPVVTVDDHRIGDGQPGTMYRRLYQKFLASI